MSVSINEITPLKDYGITALNGDPNSSFDNASSPQTANESSITWIKDKNIKDSNYKTTIASVVVAHESLDISTFPLDQKCILLSRDPKLTFSLICQTHLLPRIEPLVHPSASINKDSEIHPSCHIGPNCIIGKAKLGKNCFLRGNVFIGDNVFLGSNITIEAGAVLGSDGFGYSRDSNQKLQPFPHLGCIIVQNDVYIGANSCIDRGSLGNTVIGKGTKIDNLVHIAHNVVIGDNVVVIANAMIAGSVEIGDNAWIAPSASILNQKSIGEGSTVGMGAVVLRDVANKSTVAGVPAHPIKEFVRIQRTLRKM